MSEETWDIEIGNRTFTLPRLPFKYSRKVYPICQRLTNAGFVERIVGRLADDGTFVPPPPMQLTDEEMDNLATITLLSCQAADSTLTPDEFDNMPITPPQLYDAFFAIRKASGGWRVAEDKKTGETLETAEPPT